MSKLLPQFINMIPEEEKIKNRKFILNKSDLYFKGDRSWFIIKEYIRCDEILEITYNDIHLINTLYRKKDTPSQFRMERKDEYTVNFYNSQQCLEIYPIIIPEAPAFDIREDHEYCSISNIIIKGIKLFDMKDEFSSIDSYVHKDIAYFALTSSKGSAVISGSEVLDMDMRYSASIIKPAVIAEAKYRLADDGTICFRFPPNQKTDSEVAYISTLFRGSSLLDKQRSIIEYANDGRIEKNGVDEIVTIGINLKDFLGIFPTMDELEFSNYINIKVSDNTFSVVVTDAARRKFNANISCTSSRNISFLCRYIELPAISFLIGADKQNDSDIIQMIVNMTKRMMIIRLLDPEGTRKNDALLLRLVSTGNNSNAKSTTTP